MAGENKQIYQLTTGEFTGESLVPFEVPNPDPTTVDEKPKVTRKGSGDAIAEFVAKTQEFQTDLETASKTLIGSINELNSRKQNNLMFGALPSGTDLNNVKTTGFYWCPNTGLTNDPVPGAYGVLEVLQAAQGTWLQRYTRYGSNTVLTQYEVYVREWTNAQWYNWRNVTAVDNSCSITRTEGASSTLPLPSIQRSGNTVVVTFSTKLPVGSYTTSTKLWTCSPKPKSATYTLLHSYKSTMAEVPVYMNANGAIYFNSAFTQNTEDYIVGQLVYVV